MTKNAKTRTELNHVTRAKEEFAKAECDCAAEFLKAINISPGRIHPEENHETDETIPPAPSRAYLALTALLQKAQSKPLPILMMCLGIITSLWMAEGPWQFIALGACLELMSWVAIQPNTGLAMTAIDGSVIRSGTRKPYGIQIVAAWSKAQAVGRTDIIFPSGNDQTRNIRMRNIVNTPAPILRKGAPCYVRPQDPLTLNQAGSNTAADVETAHLLVYYEDLMGVDCHLINKATLIKRGQRFITVEDTITPIISTGYSPALRALNAASDLLKADTMYAVVGANIGIACGAVGIRGTDFGGLRVGIPGRNDPDQTEEFFLDLSEQHGLPLIPVFNSGNRAGIFIDVLQDENGTAVPVSINLVEIGPAPGEAAVSVAMGE